MARVQPRETATFTAVQQQLLDLVSEGNPVAKAAKMLGFHPNAVWAWAGSSPDFDDKLAAATRAGAHMLVERLPTEESAILDPQKAKVASDNTRWLAARMNPDAYGDKRQVTLDAAVDIGVALDAANRRVRPILDLTADATDADAAGTTPYVPTATDSVSAAALIADAADLLGDDPPGSSEPGPPDLLDDPDVRVMLGEAGGG